MVLAPYCRENVGLDEIRERQPKSFRVRGSNDGAELAANALMRISLPGKPGTQRRRRHAEVVRCSEIEYAGISRGSVVLKMVKVV